MLKTKSNYNNNKIFRSNDTTKTVCRVTTNQKPNITSEVFSREFIINDLSLSTRNLLTKGQTHDEINHDTGAFISTRGRYLSDEEKRNKIHERPLYLYIKGNSKQCVDSAVDKIEQLIQSEPQQFKMTKFYDRPPPMLRNNYQETSATGVGPPNTGNMFIEKVMIGLDHAPVAFDLRNQAIGTNGANLQYIRNETGAVVTLRGRGSLYIEPNSGIESQEPMHLYLEHSRNEGLQAAKQLAKNLIETLHQEFVGFQQMNPPTNPAFSQSSIITQTTPVMVQQSMTPMSVPPPMLAVPPPIIQQNSIDKSGTVTSILHPGTNVLHQIPPPTGNIQTVQSQPNQQNIIQSPAIIQQGVPIQLQQGNMVIQQHITPLTSVGIQNVSVPPPSVHIPIKSGPLVHLQAPPPHMSQPPPNIQLQTQTPQTTQIVLNPTQQNFQCQYIQPPQLPADGNQQQHNQVTIQHIYQPQSGILQSTQSQPQQQINQFGLIQRPQQYIVHTNTAYMVPPPNQSIIQTTAMPPPGLPPPPVQSFQTSIPAPSIIFQTQSNQPITTQLPPSIESNSFVNAGCNNGDDQANGKDDKIFNQTEDGDGATMKQTEIKTEINENGEIVPQLQLTVPPPISQSIPVQMRQISTTQISHIPVTQVPPPVMSIPPPNQIVQQIVGSTLISSAAHPQPGIQQIFTAQVQPSIQPIVSASQPQQQIHVSGPAGQQFVMNATPGPVQQVDQCNTIQNIQITGPPIVNSSAFLSPQVNATVQTNEVRTSIPQSHPIMATTTFNPHVSLNGMQLQFHTVPPPQIIQTIPSTNPAGQLIEQQQTINVVPPTIQQLQQHPPPPSQQQMMQSQQVFNTIQSAILDNQQKVLIRPPSMVPPPMNMGLSPLQSINQFVNQQLKNNNNENVNRKRKLSEDENTRNMQQSKHGIGANQRGVMQPMSDGSSNNFNNSTPVSVSTSMSSSNDCQQRPVTVKDDSLLDQIDKGCQLNLPPPSSQHFHGAENRSIYHRDNNEMLNGPPSFNEPRLRFDGNLQIPNGPPPLPSGPPRGPRMHKMDFYSMRPPQLQDGPNVNYQMNRINFGPPPPPPPFSQHNSGGNDLGYRHPPPPPPGRYRTAPW